MKTIVFSGPESSGKTQSCAHRCGLWLPYGSRIRPDLPQWNRRCEGSEEPHIAEEQLRLQLNARHSSQAFLFCDTDLLTLLVWQEWVYGSFAAELHEQYVANLPTTISSVLLTCPGRPTL